MPMTLYLMDHIDRETNSPKTIGIMLMLHHHTVDSSSDRQIIVGSLQ